MANLANMLEQPVGPYFTALLLGITSGISHCSVSCAPFISTYIMGAREGAVEGLKSFSIFTAGRVFMCAILGLAVGHIGPAFIGMTNIKYGSIIFGTALILVGLFMLVHPEWQCKKKREHENDLFGFLGGRFALNPTSHMFGVGAVFSLIPCPPMGAALVYSLQMSSVMSSGVFMLLFGIGSVVSPLLITCVAAGWLSKKIRLEAPHYEMMFRRVSGIILILLGTLSAVS